MLVRGYSKRVENPQNNSESSLNDCNLLCSGSVQAQWKKRFTMWCNLQTVWKRFMPYEMFNRFFFFIF